MERARALDLLDAIDDALDALEADPGQAVPPAVFRRRPLGITVRDRTDDLLIIWEYDAAREDLIHVRYLGADPFA